MGGGCVHLAAGAKENRGIGALELQFQAVVSHPTWVLGLNWSPLQEEAPVTTEPPLESPNMFFKNCVYCLKAWYIYIMYFSYLHLPISLPVPSEAFSSASPPPVVVSSFGVWPTESNYGGFPECRWKVIYL